MIFFAAIVLFVFVAAATLAGFLVAGITFIFGNRNQEKFVSAWVVTSGVILIGGVVYFIFIVL